MIDAAHLSPWLFVVAPLIVIVAYTVFGLSGFGSTVIAIPVLAHFLPVSYLVPLMALLDCTSAMLVGHSAREHLSKEELKRLTPFMLIGFVVGVTLLVGVPDAYLRAALGVFAVSVGLYSIANPKVHRRIGWWWAIPAGIIGGGVATVFGAGGPIYATYLGGRLDDKNRIRATLSTLISISAFVRAILYAISGLLLHATIFIGGVALSPFVLLGLRLGTRIHTGLSQEQMRRAVGGLLLVTGSSLLVRLAL
jgi:uncharacterized membrane protein YfcA